MKSRFREEEMFVQLRQVSHFLLCLKEREHTYSSQRGVKFSLTGNAKKAKLKAQLTDKKTLFFNCCSCSPLVILPWATANIKNFNNFPNCDPEVIAQGTQWQADTNGISKY